MGSGKGYVMVANGIADNQGSFVFAPDLKALMARGVASCADRRDARQYFIAIVKECDCVFDGLQAPFGSTAKAARASPACSVSGFHQ